MRVIVRGSAHVAPKSACRTAAAAPGGIARAGGMGAQATHPCPGGIRARRHCRYRRTPGGREQERGVGLHRAEGGRPGSARWLYGRHRHHGLDGRGARRSRFPDSPRPRQGPDAAVQSGRCADGPDRAQECALQDDSRADRLRQGQSRQGELWLDRQWLDQPARCRVLRLGSRRIEAPARALSGRCAGGGRCGGGSDRHDVRHWRSRPIVPIRWRPVCL